MQEISYVLTESHEIDSTIHVPINATRRIKYTCLTTSESYIAVGSTSGSVYLFSREPCSFIHLVPLSEGAVSQVQISPDEKLIALATIRGMVCLMALKPTIKLIGVSSEHVAERIECICWNDNSSEVYIGDAKGKVSIIVNSIFTVNGMFQAPTCALMHLDSRVVQMSYESSFLLISTLTRCYLCNTALEQYKQIGNQARDGEFGACFFKLNDQSPPIKPELEKIQKISNKLRTFDLISDTDSSSLDENLVKIFCARPGSRLWEVNTNGVVVKTHQFKEALAVAPLPIYKLLCPKSLKIEKSDKVCQAQSVQFYKLHVLQRKYLFTYAPTGVYILDPINAQVVLWSGEIKNIHSLSVTDNKIYVMTRSGYFRVLQFTPVNVFILKLYEQKLTKECLRAATIFKPRLLGSDRTFEENDLDQMINVLKTNQNSKSNRRISGIVVVNAGNAGSDSQDSLPYLDEIVVPVRAKPETNTNRLETNGVVKDNKDKRILCEVQEKLKLVYSLTEDLKFVTDDAEIEKRICKIRSILKVTRDEYGNELSGGLMLVFRTTELHCNNTFLESIPTNLIEQTDRTDLVENVRETFVAMNLLRSDNCGCGWYLPPSEGFSEPRFLDVGQVLLRRYRETKNDLACLNLCSSVPFLWRDYISDCDKSLFQSDDFLKKAFQTRDKVVLATVMKNLDPQRWRVVTGLVKKIEKGRCLNCEEIVAGGNEDLMKLRWNEIVEEINCSDGPETALKFMYEVNELVPDVKFELGVMRQLIFSKILNRHGVSQGVDLNSSKSNESHSICSAKIRDELISMIKKDTNVTIDKSTFGFGPHHWGMRYSSKDSTCPCCTLSLQTPVLLGNNGIALFPCGHGYHVNCMIQKKVTRCTLHSN